MKPGEARRVLVAQRCRATGALRFKLRRPEARRRYARRKVIVEPVVGQVEEDRGFATLSLRGLALAAGEYLLACLAHNLGELLRACVLPTAREATAAVRSSRRLSLPVGPCRRRGIAVRPGHVLPSAAPHADP